MKKLLISIIIIITALLIVPNTIGSAIIGGYQMKKINISTKKHPNKYALVDDEDYQKLNKYKWCFSQKKTGSAVIRKIKGINSTITMHKQIMNTPKGMVIDHINHITFDNRKCNLRICTNSENARNQLPRYDKKTSKHKGVCWYKPYKKWRSRINYNKKEINIGYFKTEKEASKAYNKKAIELFGSFAYINKIEV